MNEMIWFLWGVVGCVLIWIETKIEGIILFVTETFFLLGGYLGVSVGILIWANVSARLPTELYTPYNMWLFGGGALITFTLGAFLLFYSVPSVGDMFDNEEDEDGTTKKRH